MKEYILDTFKIGMSEKEAEKYFSKEIKKMNITERKIYLKNERKYFKFFKILLKRNRKFIIKIREYFEYEISNLFKKEQKILKKEIININKFNFKFKNMHLKNRKYLEIFLKISYRDAFGYQGMYTIYFPKDKIYINAITDYQFIIIFINNNKEEIIKIAKKCKLFIGLLQIRSNDEEGLESLGRPANEYVKKKFGEDNNSKIKLTTDGIDLSNADVGEKVGDKANEGFNIYRDDIRTETKEKAIIKTGVANPWITYTEKEIQETINKVDGKDSYVIDWKRYSKDAEYREQTNYYFYQAKHFVKAKTIDKIGKNYIEITRDNGEKLKLTEIPAKEAIYHNIEKINGEWYFKFGEDVRYKKYVNEDGYELILDQNNKPVYDPVVVGTYNFFTYNSKLELANWGRHLQDIKLWKKYGTGPNDPTTREEREEIGGAMLGISISFYYKEIEEELQTRDKNKVSLNELQEIISNINEKKLRKIINIIKK